MVPFKAKSKFCLWKNLFGIFSHFLKGLYYIEFPVLPKEYKDFDVSPRAYGP